jgi:PPP family 3-phenylpropionic acid transporter
MVGVAASVQAAAEVPAMFWTKPLMRSFGELRLFALGCAVYALSFAILSILASTALIALVRGLVGVGFSFVYVGSVLVVDGMVPLELRATGQGLVKAVSFGLAPVIGALGGGLIYGTFGPRALFAVAGTCAGCGALLSRLGARRRLDTPA